MSAATSHAPSKAMQVIPHQWQIQDKAVSMGETAVLRLTAAPGRERRQHRRHDMEPMEIAIDRWDGRGGMKKVTFGKVLDLSAGGLRIRTSQRNVEPDQQIRVRIELPAFAGIYPFIDTRTGRTQPSRAWVGWMAVARVRRVSETECDIAGRLVDMDEMDRGMLGLYLSTQPIAA